MRNKRTVMLFRLCTYPQHNDCQKSTLIRIFSLDSYCRSINYHLCQSFLLKYLIHFFVTFFDESRLFWVALPSIQFVANCRKFLYSLSQKYICFRSHISCGLLNAEINRSLALHRSWAGSNLTLQFNSEAENDSPPLNSLGNTSQF